MITKDWELAVNSYTIALPAEGALVGADGVLIVDAKSVFDTLGKPSAGSKQDRRSAIDLALLRQQFGRSGSTVRWVPHPMMPVDMMTKSDVGKGNAALTMLLKHGKWKLLEESDEMAARRAGKAKPGRSHQASLKVLDSMGFD